MLDRLKMVVYIWNIERVVKLASTTIYGQVSQQGWHSIPQQGRFKKNNVDLGSLGVDTASN